MINRKYLSLIALAIIGFSIIGNVSASTVHVDGYGGLVHCFWVKDLTNGEKIWYSEVAAGYGHKKNIGVDHKFHQMEFIGMTSGYYETILYNVYGNEDVDLYYTYDHKLSYKFRGLNYTIGGTVGKSKSVVI